MTDLSLTRVRLQGGRYEALLDAAAPTAIEAVHDGKVIAVARLSPEDSAPGRFRVALDLPAIVIGEGVQIVTIRAAQSGHVLDRVTLMSGDPLDEDIRAELALLRDELELLKHAFRRHCADTTGR
ncbi:hypothetical protein [Roseicyclus marinus]|uniref:hypothetical protein n=1 Tax=Roseicyclus marinus TaxID=2161673 RepID=UPI00240F3E41|nr:hypothetical protein [Roseicyclus marinus]MDG3041501.1 hypothetical protein [Roseicyclus marinus]